MRALGPSGVGHCVAHLKYLRSKRIEPLIVSYVGRVQPNSIVPRDIHNDRPSSQSVMYNAARSKRRSLAATFIAIEQHTNSIYKRVASL
jgi:hypothetical protein